MRGLVGSRDRDLGLVTMKVERVWTQDRSRHRERKGRLGEPIVQRKADKVRKGLHTSQGRLVLTQQCGRRAGQGWIPATLARCSWHKHRCPKRQQQWQQKWRDVLCGLPAKSTLSLSLILPLGSGIFF